MNRQQIQKIRVWNQTKQKWEVYDRRHWPQISRAGLAWNTVSLWTGLTDAGGRKIYEGDLIANKEVAIKKLTPGAEVYMEHGCWMSKGDPIAMEIELEDCINWIGGDWALVTGNIWALPFTPNDK